MYDPTKPYKAQIKHLIKETWQNNAYCTITDGLYNIIREKHNLATVDHCDGIGTKGLFHWERRTFKEAAQDALAMNINDLLLVGAKAYKTQVHLMMPEDDHSAIVETMHYLSELCKSRNIAITGGETSVNFNLQGMELALVVSGVIIENRLPTAKIGDKLICLPSSGVHSNGFTKISDLWWNVPEELNDFSWLTTPTRLYDNVLLERNLPIHAAMHVTGGAWTKIKDILPDNSTARFSEWNIPDCFNIIYNKDKSTKMYSMFNMGVGMVLSVSPDDADWVANAVGGFVGGEISVGEGKNVVLYSNLYKKEISL